MLVLGRKPGEKIIIGNDITIHVLESSHPRNIRIGVEAPSTISVHREEIYKKIKIEEETLIAKNF